MIIGVVKMGTSTGVSLLGSSRYGTSLPDIFFDCFRGRVLSRNCVSNQNDLCCIYILNSSNSRKRDQSKCGKHIRHIRQQNWGYRWRSHKYSADVQQFLRSSPGWDMLGSSRFQIP